MDAATFARFEAKIRRREDGCWEWTAGRDCDGYGRLEVRSSRTRTGFRPVGAHKISYEHFVGPVPDGLCVRHRCDRPWCVNPNHLEPGTIGDNNRDRMERGRQVRGADSPNTTLTNEQAVAVRTAYAQGGVTQKALAVAYGISRAAVGNIVRGDSWSTFSGPRVRRWKGHRMPAGSADEIRRLFAAGTPRRELSTRFGVSRARIQQITSSARPLLAPPTVEVERSE